MYYWNKRFRGTNATQVLGFVVPMGDGSSSSSLAISAVLFGDSCLVWTLHIHSW